MVENGIIHRVATSTQDPHAVFKLEKITKRIKYKECDISYTIYKDKYGEFTARWYITIHAETVDKYYCCAYVHIMRENQQLDYFLQLVK